MRSVPRRPLVAVLSGLVVLGIAGVTRVATAQPVQGGPAAAAAAAKAPRPPLVRPAKPTGAQPVQLEVKLKSDRAVQASAAHLGRVAAADAVTTVPVKGPDEVVVTVPANEVDTTLAKLRDDASVASAKVQARYYASDVTPNDPWIWRQNNVKLAKLPTAWSTTTGSDDLTVAVIDTGVSPVSELSGALLPGYDFANNDTNPADDFGHGTMVASLIAGSTDNGTLLAGGCWTCRILPVKVLGKDGSGTALAVANGIDFAIEHKADVINMSLGGNADVKIRDAVARAVKAHIPVIAAAGNSGTSTKEYPAAYPGVLAVGATDLAGQPFEWSNYGTDWVDIAATGQAWMQYTDGEALEALGTSFATPLVASAAALVLAAHPGATDTEVLGALTSTAVYTGGPWTYGVLDAAAAVKVLPFTGKAQPSVRVTGPVNRYQHGPATITLATGADVVSMQGTDGTADLGTDTAAPWTVSWNPDARDGAGSADGQHTVQVVVTDSTGDKTTVPVSLELDRTAPSITGAAPAQNTKRRGAVTVTATGVADANGVTGTDLYADGKWVGRDAVAPYAATYQSKARNGVVKLQWRITDRAGNVTRYDRSIIADNTAPTVTITGGPKNKAKVKGTVKVSVAARDAYGVNRVELLINGKLVTADKWAPYAFSVKVGKYAKKLKVQVRAYDTVGNLRYAPTRTWKR